MITFYFHKVLGTVIPILQWEPELSYVNIERDNRHCLMLQ